MFSRITWSTVLTKSRLLYGSRSSCCRANRNFAPKEAKNSMRSYDCFFYLSVFWSSFSPPSRTLYKSGSSSASLRRKGITSLMIWSELESRVLLCDLSNAVLIRFAMLVIWLWLALSSRIWRPFSESSSPLISPSSEPTPPNCLGCFDLYEPPYFVDRAMVW